MTNDRSTLGDTPPSADGNAGFTSGPILCGDVDIRIDRGGTWFYHGSPIGRKELVRLFASVLSRDTAGEYWMITPAEKCRIQVEDVPFVAIELSISGQGRGQILSFRTNVDDTVTVDEEHPLHVIHHAESGEPSPYVHVRGGLDARLSRAVYYELVGLGVEEDIDGERHYGVWSSGVFFPLGQLDTSS